MTNITPTLTTYTELQQAYDSFNQNLFEGRLPDCMLTLQREKRTYGYFSADRFGAVDGRKAHEIALNPAFFAIVPLVETAATLVHEMAHLWQHVYGKPGRGRYHNDEWAMKMESIGLMPSSTGKPGGRRVGDQMADYPIPGGKFLWACDQLLTEEFKISWFDRFVPYAPIEQGDHSAVSQTLPPTSATAAMHVAANNGVSISPLRVVKPISDSGSDGRESSAAASIYGPSRRSKYVCQCTPKPMAVWGKTGMKIRCEICCEIFREI